LHDVPARDLPLWIGVLDAAEAWGCPPWEISPPDNKFLWFMRRQMYEDVKNRAMKERYKKQRQKRRG
jgi:hypothetical protein